MPGFGTLALGALVATPVLMYKYGTFTVEGGYRGVVYSRLSGIDKEIRGEGLHLLFPWLQRAYIYDIRQRAVQRGLGGLTGTRDLQMVNIGMRLIYRPNENRLPEIYTSLGMDFGERVIPSIANEVLKSVIAQFNASQLITQRENISQIVKRNLIERAAEFNIVIDDVAIVSTEFSPTFTEAVESKQVEQQKAERARYQVEQALQDKKSAIIRASGEAKAAELLARSMGGKDEGKGYIAIKQIEAARDISRSIAGSSNRVYLNSDALMVPLLAQATSKQMLDEKKK